jgi:2-amino-4-hydroxy-6-hydroxymethyldihydropteridine diphosphokinase
MPEGRGVEALVSIGSNVDPERNLPRAVALLDERFDLLALSSAWATAPVGPAGQPCFLNAVAQVAADEPPLALRAALRALESLLGRRRSGDRFAPRPIDLDLVAYDRETLDSDGLRLPDPDLLRETYLAVPAAEVAPDWIHPGTGETLRNIAARLLAAQPEAARPRRTPLALCG